MRMLGAFKALVLLVLAIPFSLANPLNVTVNLTGKDVGDFIGTSPTSNVYTLAYDSKNDGVYFGGGNFPMILFGYFNRSANTSIDLRGTLLSMENWSDSISSIAFDTKNSGAYFVGSRGIFGYYNSTRNLTFDLRETDAADFIGTNTINSYLTSVVYDTTNDGAYIAGDNGILAYYNRTKNATTDLREVDLNDFIGTKFISSLAYDSKNDGAYIVGDFGLIAYYNKSSNIAVNLSNSNIGDFIGTKYISSAAYDSKSDGIYIVGEQGLFAYYNRTANSTFDLSETDTGNFIGTTSLNTVVYDSTRDGALFVGDNGMFGYYNKKFNISIDLRSADTGDWIGNTSPLFGLAYDSNNDGVYVGGWYGIFGEFFAPAIKVLTNAGTNRFVDLGNSISLTFSSVSSGGVTSVSKSTESPSLSKGFSLNGVYYDMSTTAAYTGTITVTLPYDPSTVADASALKLYHFDTVLNSWVDVTVSVDTTAHTVTGVVASLSWFAVGIPLSSFNFGGFLQPINNDGSSTFKLGQTVPVKFQLTDSSGQFVTDAVAHIFVAKIVDGVVGAYQEGVSTSAPKSENIFRHDATDNHYIFNLNTKKLSEGMWLMMVKLSDGALHSIPIEILS